MGSPRIEAFAKASAENTDQARAALVADLKAAGGPIVEPLVNQPGKVLVSFVYVGSDKPVTLRCQLFPRQSERLSHAMERVAGTDVWYASTPADADLSIAYRFVVDDPMSGVGSDLAKLFADKERLMALTAESLQRSHADPYNPDAMFPMMALMTAGVTDGVPRERWDSVLTLPSAEPLRHYGTPPARGEIQSHTFTSRMFPGERTVGVYVPHRYDPDRNEPYAAVVMLDGEYWRTAGRIDVMLDNLIADGDIPPLLAVLVHNATPVSRMVEMTCNPDHPGMLADELLPWLRQQYHATVEPARTVIGGASYGGLASIYAAFERPDAFGNVVSMSASLWWGLASEADGPSCGRDHEPEWLTRQYAQAERKPIRFWIDVGRLETGPIPQAPGVEMFATSRHFRTVLHAKGYEIVGYREQAGAHDFANWRRTLPAGLTALLGS